MFCPEFPAPLLVAAYEVVSSTHWNPSCVGQVFAPNWTVDVTNQFELKLDLLRGCRAQMRPFPHPRSLEVVRALAQFRGSHAGMRYGEAFQVVRMTSPPEFFAPDELRAASFLPAREVTGA